MVAFADGESFFMSDNDCDHDSDWLICKHFKHTDDVIQHYINLNSLVITQGVILCEKCYRKMMEGRSEEVIDSCLGLTADGWEEIFGWAIYKANRQLLRIFKHRSNGETNSN